MSQQLYFQSLLMWFNFYWIKSKLVETCRSSVWRANIQAQIFLKRKLFPKTLKRLWNHVALNNHLIMLKYYPSQSCSKKVKVSHKIIDCAYKRRGVGTELENRLDLSTIIFSKPADVIQFLLDQIKIGRNMPQQCLKGKHSSANFWSANFSQRL